MWVVAKQAFDPTCKSFCKLSDSPRASVLASVTTTLFRGRRAAVKTNWGQRRLIRLEPHEPGRLFQGGIEQAGHLSGLRAGRILAVLDIKLQPTAGQRPASGFRKGGRGQRSVAGEGACRCPDQEEPRRVN
ncbi:hypothetical protein GGTG_09294 [Gaeumannomyces tritici R3-111a-1]|uniref:Uncharacterized protein n=1 Tax=Gaeumannomyces tritici (strain R3-111a-1) TaxID=644352 RepID=J3P6Z7_GAET3|nr:hypothetical protein GGTG_09294 [Gaeumannomyces tritici R3-111a-1]EJT72428.1 hypothetical protein GGTG_09294 [Gaeumannomyces tritici R3-111a-1]